MQGNEQIVPKQFLYQFVLNNIALNTTVSMKHIFALIHHFDFSQNIVINIINVNVLFFLLSSNKHNTALLATHTYIKTALPC